MEIPPPTGLRLWLLAARPKTLTIAVVPVAVGSALAWAEKGVLSWPVALAALFGAVMIQAATNLHNDSADFERGGDPPDRLGPTRVTAAGWAAPGRVRGAALACIAAAGLAGLYLVWVGGWPILALGMASVVAGWAYSGGPVPISHTPLGELFVLGFFGIGATMGSHYLQTGEPTAAALLAGVGVGAPAAAVLMVNNFRDRDADRRAGRRTLALVLGAGGSRVVYALAMALPFFLLAPLSGILGGERPLWIALAAAPPALALAVRLWRAEPGPELNLLLARTAQTQVLIGALLYVGLVM